MTLPDLNIDLGENESPEIRAALMQVADSVNICCGFHAGTPLITLQTLRLAMERNRLIGAHPGLIGEGGRGEANLQPDEFIRILDTQVAPFVALCHSLGGICHHLKLHGSLYHATDQFPELAEALVEWMRQHFPTLILYCRSLGPTAVLARKAELTVWDEIFAERGYEANGQLVSRQQLGALLNESEVTQRLHQWLKDHSLTTTSGEIITLPAQTICLHADSPDAVTLGRKIRLCIDEFTFS